MSLKLQNIDDVFFREVVIREIIKQKIRNEKKEKLGNKRNNPSYLIHLYNKTGDERYLKKAISLKIGDKNPKSYSEKPHLCLERDIPEIRYIFPEETEILKVDLELQELIEEEINRDVSPSNRNILYSSYRDDPYNSSTFRESIASGNNIS